MTPGPKNVSFLTSFNSSDAIEFGSAAFCELQFKEKVLKSAITSSLQPREWATKKQLRRYSYVTLKLGLKSEEYQ